MASTVWRGHLAFGLVSFPVRLYRAARAEKVNFRRLYRPGSAETSAQEVLLEHRSEKQNTATAPAPPPPDLFRTRNTITADTHDQPVSDDNLVKGYEYDKGQYVVLEDDELRALKPETSKQMEIVEFVRMEEIDPVYLETSYYVSPEEVGERPYSLLFEAMRESGFVGLAQFAMHSREHVVILRTGHTGLIAHTMFYADEVRRVEEFRAETTNLNARELDLAKRLIESMVVPFEPEKFRDTYREGIEQMIQAKVAGRQVSRTAAAPRIAAVVDIMQALQESLNAAKKPAAAEPSATRKSKAGKAG
jgi:DNA end-binding protein Ku